MSGATIQQDEHVNAGDSHRLKVENLSGLRSKSLCVCAGERPLHFVRITQ